MNEIMEKDIENMIYEIRGKQVMLDSDLARLYHVETRDLNKSVKRNLDRFPDSFMFKLTEEEYRNLMFQIGTSNGRGGRRKPPNVFTEQGGAMLVTVLRTEVAEKGSIRIMDA